MNLLFVCSRNIWRSRTAETIFKNRVNMNVKSAGTAKSARIQVTQKLIEWANVIFVMENKHKKRIAEKFQGTLNNKEVIVLDIPDEYQYMDEDLIQNLEDAVTYYIEDK